MCVRANEGGKERVCLIRGARKIFFVFIFFFARGCARRLAGPSLTKAARIFFCVGPGSRVRDGAKMFFSLHARLHLIFLVHAVAF